MGELRHADVVEGVRATLAAYVHALDDGRTDDVVATFCPDGAVDIEVSRNGQTLCRAPAGYGREAGYFNTMRVAGVEEKAMVGHISDIETCTEGLGSTQKGDEWSVKALYNMTAHPPMREQDGSPSLIMGVAIVFITA